jgi:hypothetical protein
MLIVAIIIWIVVGTTLAGIGLAVVVSTPALAVDSMRYIPWAVLAGFVVAIPVSWGIAVQIAGPRHAR